MARRVKPSRARLISRTYTTAATYTVTLLVTDSSGRTATVSVTMQIAP